MCNSPRCIRTPQGFRAFSAICTHLGCIVGWDAARHQIACPCHAGFFDINGRPVAGPPRMAPYFLYAGTLEPRKNLDMLLGVWREVHSRYGVELVLAGRARSDFSAPAPEPGLHVLGEVPDEDLAAAS